MNVTTAKIFWFNGATVILFSHLYSRMASAMEAAGTVWDYLVVGDNLAPSDLILVCCSNDLRVADRAVQLYRDVIICSIANKKLP